MVEKGKMRITLKAYDHAVIDRSAKEIFDTVYRTGAIMKGPIPLPTSIEKHTILRSPHVDKKSRDQFELRTHKRIIDIIDPSQKTMDALMSLNLSAGVQVNLKVI